MFCKSGEKHEIFCASEIKKNGFQDSRNKWIKFNIYVFLRGKQIVIWDQRIAIHGAQIQVETQIASLLVEWRQGSFIWGRGEG